MKQKTKTTKPITPQNYTPQESKKIAEYIIDNINIWNRQTPEQKKGRTIKFHHENTNYDNEEVAKNNGYPAKVTVLIAVQHELDKKSHPDLEFINNAISIQFNGKPVLTLDEIFGPDKKLAKDRHKVLSHEAKFKSIQDQGKDSSALNIDSKLDSYNKSKIISELKEYNDKKLVKVDQPTVHSPKKAGYVNKPKQSVVSKENTQHRHETKKKVGFWEWLGNRIKENIIQPLYNVLYPVKIEKPEAKPDNLDTKIHQSTKSAAPLQSQEFEVSTKHRDFLKKRRSLSQESQKTGQSVLRK